MCRKQVIKPTAKKAGSGFGGKLKCRKAAKQEGRKAAKRGAADKEKTMDEIVISGGRKLTGEIAVSG